ncbi:MAG: nucleotidyltransferase domain-containing protein [Chloroflexota bacterium]
MAQTLGLEREVPQQTIRALHAALGERLVAVVLFGSHARGEEQDESDWDLLLIAEGLQENYFDRQLFLHHLLFTCHTLPSMIARTRQEFESHLPSLYLDIAVDGQALFDPTGYAAKRLLHLRRLIKEAGLYRDRTPAGDVWRWKTQPRGPWVMTWEKIGKTPEKRGSLLSFQVGRYSMRRVRCGRLASPKNQFCSRSG